MKLSLCLLLYSFVSICMKYLFLSLYFQSVSFHLMCLFIYFFEGSICYGSCFLHKSAILSFNWSIFKSSSEDLPIDFREGKMQGGRERERERETLMSGRNTDYLPVIHALTGDQTCSLSVYGTMFQPPETHLPGHYLEPLIDSHLK